MFHIFNLRKYNNKIIICTIGYLEISDVFKFKMASCRHFGNVWNAVTFEPYEIVKFSILVENDHVYAIGYPHLSDVFKFKMASSRHLENN